jgi:hypothetical protein
MNKIVVPFVATVIIFCSCHTLYAERKSIKRVADPIVLRGDRFGSLKGVPVSHLCLYSMSGGKMTVAPSQIDERDAKGMLSLTSPNGAAINPDDGKLDANDELVFMVRDCGDRAKKRDLPFGVEKAVEITCINPVTDGEGWVYLAAQSEPVKADGGRYVSYDLAKDYITAKNYELGYTPGASESYFNTMILKNGEEGRSPDILDRFKFRFDMTLFFSIIKVRRTENEMRSTLTGYKNGPIRAVRRCNNSMYIKFGIRSPSSTTDNYYYGNTVEWPTLISLPFNVSTIASEAFLFSGCDWNMEANGMHYFNSLNGPVLVNGVMSEKERHLDKKPYAWSVLSGEQGTLMSRLWLSPSLVMEKELLYIDNKTAYDPPEDNVGHWGYNGWRFDIITVSKGTHKFISYFYFPEDSKPGFEKAYLDILDHPVQVRTALL